MEADKREIARPQKMVWGGEAARARPRWPTLPSLSSKRKRLAFFPRPTPTRNTNTPRRCLLLAPPLLPLLSHHQARPASTPARPAPAFAASAALMRVRPYTVSKGDTLDSIAAKRGMPVDDLITLNAGHVSKARPLTPGTALVLPAARLSARDKDILAGITPGASTRFRPYPVRKGEAATDIAVKRDIRLADLAALNPGVDLGRLKANQVIKLPAGKFSVREREMLTGGAALPDAFFKGPLAGVPAGVAGAGALAAAAVVVSILFRKAKAGEA